MSASLCSMAMANSIHTKMCSYHQDQLKRLSNNFKKHSSKTEILLNIRNREYCCKPRISWNCWFNTLLLKGEVKINQYMYITTLRPWSLPLKSQENVGVLLWKSDLIAICSSKCIQTKLLQNTGEYLLTKLGFLHIGKRLQIYAIGDFKKV